MSWQEYQPTRGYKKPAIASITNGGKRINLSKTAAQHLPNGGNVVLLSDERKRIAIMPVAEPTEHSINLVVSAGGQKSVNCPQFLLTLGYTRLQHFDTEWDGQMLILTPQEAQP